MTKIQSVRGMNDLLPDQSPVWHFLESTFREVVSAYGYEEIRFPVLESTDLFCRSIGEATDIVEKEMYTFQDRNGDSLTLRPEGTACCVRAGLQNGLFYNQTQRLWYSGPMFRHERPQKGRLRQFHQLGVEAFGMAGPDIDAELLLLCRRFWDHLGVQDAVVLEINSLGMASERHAYREALVNYLSQFRQELDEDSQRRLQSNPLRILDSKDPRTQSVLVEAPALEQYLGDDTRRHFDGLMAILDAAGIVYRINPKLVRGLDYYNHTVFEWVTDRLGAQGTVCAGGRFDGLVEQLGGQRCPAVGMAMGVERLVLLLETVGVVPESVGNAVDAYLVVVTEQIARVVAIAEEIRHGLVGVHLVVNAGGGSMKAQMKRADKSGASIAIIIGDDELQSGMAVVKYLREERPQETVPFAALSAIILQSVY